MTGPLELFIGIGWSLSGPEDGPILFFLALRCTTTKVPKCRTRRKYRGDPTALSLLEAEICQHTTSANGGQKAQNCLSKHVFTMIKPQ
jgi:hypothetical protein